MSTFPSRWIIFGICLIFCCIGGSAYAFGLISDSIKDTLNISQYSLDIIATVGNIGAFLKIIPGIFNNHGKYVLIYVFL